MVLYVQLLFFSVGARTPNTSGCSVFWLVVTCEKLDWSIRSLLRHLYLAVFSPPTNEFCLFVVTYKQIFRIQKL